MRALLQQSGFRISGNRADCIYCDGSSKLTVSFTDEVAFCHRCKWTENVRTFSRKLGKEVTPETEANRRAREQFTKFAIWQNESLERVSSQYRRLGRSAALAMTVVDKFPDCQPAWDALARFYHAEAKLCQELDLLSLEKASVWEEV